MELAYKSSPPTSSNNHRIIEAKDQLQGSLLLPPPLPLLHEQEELLRKKGRRRYKASMFFPSRYGSPALRFPQVWRKVFLRKVRLCLKELVVRYHGEDLLGGN